jgi:hypothetical protein
VSNDLQKASHQADRLVSLSYLILGIIAYLLCIQYSRDWVHYLWWYGILDRTSWEDWFATFSLMREPLYGFSAKLIGEWLSFTVFAGLATISLLFLKLRYLSKIVENPYVGTFFYAGLYLLLFEGTVLRVAYATAFVIPGLYFLQQKKYWLSALFIMLGGLIHFSAFVYLVAFMIYFARPLSNLILWAFVTAPLLAIFDYSILSLFRDSIATINPRYLLYLDQKVIVQNSTGLYFYFIAFFALILLAIEFFLRSLLRSDRFALTLQRLAMLGVILMCALHDHVAVGARLGEMLLLPIVILLSWLYMHFDQNRKALLKCALVAGFIAYMLARSIYLYPSLWA